MNSYSMFFGDSQREPQISRDLCSNKKLHVSNFSLDLQAVLPPHWEGSRVPGPQLVNVPQSKDSAGGAQQVSAGYTCLEGIQVPMALLLFGPTLVLLYHHGLSLLSHGKGLA